MQTNPDDTRSNRTASRLQVLIRHWIARPPLALLQVPPTKTTNWPGACPNSDQAQRLFDMGLVWRMMFNDNEAACAFR